MNIYEEELLEENPQQVTDQIGHLLLDLILASLMKVNSENRIFKEFEEARTVSFDDEPKF